jgi:hypothetical protein
MENGEDFARAVAITIEDSIRRNYSGPYFLTEQAGGFAVTGSSFGMLGNFGKHGAQTTKDRQGMPRGNWCEVISYSVKISGSWGA